MNRCSPSNERRAEYREIVERYQNLLCALALSACGDFAQSQDFAQETFAIAWQQIGREHQPDNMKSWLCGILRNLVRDARRRRSRGWRKNVLPLDHAAAALSTEPPPAEDALSREEAAIIRRALAALPRAYREPLVLFYHEDQSIARVAAALDLSEEVVRQRLARGRKMLKRRFLQAFETSLCKTRPGPQFTAAAMTVLTSTARNKTAGLAITAAAGAPVGKALLGAGSFAAFLAPALSPLLSFFATPRLARWVGRAQKTPQNKAYMTRFAWMIGIITTVSSLLLAVICMLPQFILHHPVLFALTLAATLALQVGLVLLLSLRAHFHLKKSATVGT